MSHTRPMDGRTSGVGDCSQPQTGGGGAGGPHGEVWRVCVHVCARTRSQSPRIKGRQHSFNNLYYPAPTLLCSLPHLLVAFVAHSHHPASPRFRSFPHTPLFILLLLLLILILNIVHFLFLVLTSAALATAAATGSCDAAAATGSCAAPAAAAAAARAVAAFVFPPVHS
eukprot:GHVU01102884.1.p1 GENE.GHVU01102884.1~~GHVU01102884.1.p1  ORF type:complete len:169 (+),score=22.80 GHVU01102884.1:119-625(+)